MQAIHNHGVQRNSMSLLNVMKSNEYVKAYQMRYSCVGIIKVTTNCVDKQIF